MKISKHHYALELAERGNNVYFINPPQYQLNENILVENISENLKILSYKPVFPFKIRFHARWLYDYLIRIQIKKILKYTEKKVDVIWCFETNLFSNLKLFNADISIYHPVDMVDGVYQKKIINSASAIITLSEVIKVKLQKETPQKNIHFIGHGLNKDFAEQAKSYLQNIKTRTQQQTNACFIGNLMIKSLDRNTFRAIIEQNQNVKFTFYGSYILRDANIGGEESQETIPFSDFLKLQPNVLLAGPKNPNEILAELHQFDVFILLINPQNDINKGSNSHKILEYLSTGKVVVSNHVSTYSQTGLIEMVQEMNNEKFPTLFQKVISNLEHYNSPELQRKRIAYALDNTYEKQIERIEKIISENINTNP